MAIEVGSKLQGKVTGITHFGAFVELPGGVTGLVHISEIADYYVKDVRDVLKINDIVTVKVLNISENGKIGLSIRQAQDNYDPRARKRRRERDVSFEEKLSRFLRESEDRLASLRRHGEGRRGRGARKG
ncbi:MAG: S1 domain-containing RNA-binding protein [Calditerricola sp.]|jgi:Predicted RNA binding protein (contains ribosomal protein S1 domain)|nr:RNA-binding protein S1 [Bacillota bacterium]MCG0314034.1 S1 domain-containing RNA-binding protein [Calditerricola sp.]